MSLLSNLVASHLNKIQAGRLDMDWSLEFSDQTPAQVKAQKIALRLVCMGFGLKECDRMFNSK